MNRDVRIACRRNRSSATNSPCCRTSRTLACRYGQSPSLLVNAAGDSCYTAAASGSQQYTSVQAARGAHHERESIMVKEGAPCPYPEKSILKASRVIASNAAQQFSVAVSGRAVDTNVEMVFNLQDLHTRPPNQSPRFIREGRSRHEGKLTKILSCPLPALKVSKAA
jgi:hypothetical protein